MVLPRWTYTTHQPSTTIINIQSNEGKSLSSAAASSHVPDGRTRLCVAVCYYYFQHLYALAAFTSPCLARRKKNPIVLYSIPRIFREKNQRNKRGGGKKVRRVMEEITTDGDIRSVRLFFGGLSYS